LTSVNPALLGLELLARMGEFGIELPVIVLTGHGDVPTAVKALGHLSWPVARPMSWMW
jgi:FixJ family two-component response regulator